MTLKSLDFFAPEIYLIMKNYIHEIAENTKLQSLLYLSEITCNYSVFSDFILTYECKFSIYTYQKVHKPKIK